MFEKEAEEYAENIELDTKWNNPRQVIEQAYIAGAEFGYNKAKEEMQEQGLALQSDMDKTIEQNIQLKKQIDKIRNYLANDIPHELINEATNKIWKMAIKEIKENE